VIISDQIRDLIRDFMLFHYTAVSQSGERKEGSQEAASSSELAKILREEGFILTSVKTEGEKTRGFNLAKHLEVLKIFGRVPLVEKMFFARHLSLMVKAGFSLNKALSVLALQTKNRRFSVAILKMEADVRGGTAFGDALAKYPNIFSDLFINMVKVGEVTGNLEENLKILAIQMKKDHELFSRVKSALIYPCVILVAMLGIGAAMMIFVMPKLISVFEELNAELPLMTRIIIGISRFMTNQWWLVIILLAGIIFGVRFVLKTPAGRDLLDRAILKAPIFGNISKKINSARMARTLSSLIESGVSIVKALEITANTMTNVFFNRAIFAASQEVQKGTSLSKNLVLYPDLFMPIVTQMIQVGEETGTLGEITKRLAEFYEEEVANITKGLSTIIEPILMIIIGVAVGFFAISMIQPMYSMMNAI